jgi:RNA polymerase sigma-70 factor, ECF subfamily
MQGADQPSPGEGPGGGQPSSSDRSLLRRLRLGDQNAATQLYFRYAERLRLLAHAECSNDLARRVEVEDIIQSVFSSFFRGVNKGYYEVPEGEELWQLFLVIALNKIRAKGNFHRAARRDVRQTVGGNALANLAPQGEEDAAFHELKLTIDEIMSSLPEAQQQMVEMRIEGFDLAEIAEKTRRSKRTVERNLQEFRKKLADSLRPYSA